MRSMSYSMPASRAMARMCSTVFVLPPIAMSRTIELSIESWVTISRGSRPWPSPFFSKSNTICTTRLAARRKSFFRSALVASSVPLVGRAMPSASHRQFMLLAVNMPEHEPQVGQPACSNANRSSALSLPPCLAAAALKTSIRSTVRPSGILPASIGPPLTKTVGTLQRMAPINMPGTILSQLGMQIMPSKQWARSIVSTESAISSRLGSENFIPSWPMAMPSSTPIVWKINGVPPAWRTHCLTNWPTLSKWTWPGMMSTWLLQMAMNGLRKSSSFRPVARSRLRWGARASPNLTMSDRMSGNPSRKGDCENPLL